MDPIQDAVEAIDSRPSGETFTYTEVATIFKVHPETLRRRHQGSQGSCTAYHSNRMHLNPQQELELVAYIEDLTKQGLPPTRTMIRNFGSVVAQKPVSERWVSRFLERNKDHLTSKWSVGMDRNRHKADNMDSYSRYFALLHAKIRQYDVDARHIYNMDEKGFLIGVTSRQKRVFSKQLWEQKKVTAGIQDGNREWITILATVCADGSWLDPGVIFEG
jgi:hypothetical protein